MKGFLLYFTETVSDICSSVFLFCQGSYKPSLLIMRSAVENYTRCLGIFENCPVHEIKSVYDLHSFVRKLDIVQQDIELTRWFDKLVNTYKLLCSYVHAENVNYMSLTTAIGVFPFYSDDTVKDYKEYFFIISKAILSFQSIMFNEVLHEMYYKDSDMIHDVLPKEIKKLLNA